MITSELSSTTTRNVVTGEVRMSMSLPVDSDGFLRRACPTCEREFKWLPAREGAEDVAQPEDAGYFCPYCGVQAPSESWLTEAQVALAQNIVAREAVAPLLRDFGRSLEDMGRQSGGFITASVNYEEPEEADPLTEDDDMRRVDFACHPTEPVKVLDDWKEPIYCLVCGAQTT
jgi:hypothetical protein